MKYVLSICALLSSLLLPLHAGYVVTIADGREANGKVVLTAKGVQVQTSSSPTDIDLGEILEADFNDAPFQITNFNSNGEKGANLPPNWKGQDIGDVDSPGSIKAKDGVYTLTGSGNFPDPNKKKGPKEDRLFFVGQQWTGDGQWSVRIKDIDNQSPDTSAGLMLRDTFDPSSICAVLETSCLGAGGFGLREKTDSYLRPDPISITPPVWVRFTRFGMSVFASVSTDNAEWDLIGELDFKSVPNPWVGLYAHTRREKEPGNAIFDDVEFAPAPSSAQVLPPGVMLQGGSFVAATCTHMIIDPKANSDVTGNFERNDHPLNFSSGQIAFITMIPLQRSVVAAMGSKPGLIMKNGDVLADDPQTFNKGGVEIDSLVLGDTLYKNVDIRASVIHPLQVQPAKYEIRLTDGSMIHANDITTSGTAMAIDDISGAKILVPVEDLAQIRAGSAQAQSLAELAWKATPPAAASAPKATPTAPAPAAAPGAAANAAPALAPGVPAPDVTAAPLVGSFKGPNQEQVLEAQAGTAITFPLSGKFRAVAMRVMIAPDSPSAQATVRVIADGREVGRTPAFKAGDQPRLVQITVESPKSISLIADSPLDNTKVLYIDPTALRN